MKRIMMTICVNSTLLLLSIGTAFAQDYSKLITWPYNAAPEDIENRKTVIASILGHQTYPPAIAKANISFFGLGPERLQLVLQLQPWLRTLENKIELSKPFEKAELQAKKNLARNKTIVVIFEVDPSGKVGNLKVDTPNVSKKLTSLLEKAITDQFPMKIPSNPLFNTENYIASEFYLDRNNLKVAIQRVGGYPQNLKDYH